MKALVTALLGFAVVAGPVQAQTAAPASSLLHPMFQDHAVLQRGRPVPVWGQAQPGQSITVTFLGRNHTTKAGKDGAWRLDLPAAPPGGPHDLTVTSGGKTTTIRDLLVGDVYLCSGQSNMQWQVRQSRNADSEIAHSAEDRIRLLSFERHGSPRPEARPVTPVAWTAATPETVAPFSAVCYFFGRDIAKKHDVPVGLIHSSWGGSIIQDWLPASGLKAVGGFDDSLAVLDAYAADPEAASRDLIARTQSWAAVHDPGTKGGWQTIGHDDTAWGDLTLPRIWEEQGRPDLADLDGIVWFRKHIILTAQEAGQPAVLSLGTVDERDAAWVNGVQVGASIDYRVERRYEIPAGVLREGDNVIAVRAVDEFGGGGLRSSADKLFLTLGEKQLVLTGTWRYRIAADFRQGLSKPPFVPWIPAKGYTNLYNAMIAPVGPYGLSGVLWFQGEQNTAEPDAYARLLPQLISDWRGQFGSSLPFLIVQLTNYGAPSFQPQESGFAAIRDVQRRTAEAVPQTGLAIAVDLGNPRDIHSPEKQEVARRLTLEAGRLIYGEAAAPRSPRPLSAVRDGATVRVTFDRKLVTYSGPRPLAFELCAEVCAWADGRVEGDTVVLEAPAAATKVRYAWAGSPVVNLYSEDGLPAGTFELHLPSSSEAAGQ